MKKLANFYAEFFIFFRSSAFSLYYLFDHKKAAIFLRDDDVSKVFVTFNIIIIFSLATSFLSMLLKLIKSSRRYEEFICQC